MEGFERETQAFIQWCSEYFLEVKNVIDFGQNKITVPPCKINGDIAERVSTYKYLGVEIDHQLKFSQLAESKSRKLQQRLFFLRKVNSFRASSTCCQ